ncbi:peptidase M50 [Desulfobacca acetoxidans DSM 11109]|uniref:Peptidase M50 n=2 Tax=Desulfobacca acetoxidans TaxID=60893 RepID=F2NJ76_DESAR|nr:peptidase M50 [Desulfobacca acetoxidans DSM 11109]
MVVVLFFSVIVHEVAHGYVALKNGDSTAKDYGRLTMNPLPHIDLVGTILVPAVLYFSHSGVLFGWAKPVPVNPANFRNYRLGEITVSAAGPLSNLLLAAVFAQLLPWSGGNPGFFHLCKYGVIINLYLMLFNLIPIPPLDGSKIVMPLLPRSLQRLYAQLEPVGFILILLLLYSGLWGVLLRPIFRFFMELLLG